MSNDPWKIHQQENTWRKAEKTLSLVDIFHLKDLGVIKILINYSGGGDSGQIDHITYHNKYFYPYDLVNSSEIPEKIRVNVEDAAYRLLDGINDWYNNEGGYGTIHIELSDLEYNIDAHYYEEAPSTYNEETGEYDYDYDNQDEWGQNYTGKVKINL